VLPMTEDVASQVLSLPMHPSISVAESERVVSAIDMAINSN